MTSYNDDANGSRTGTSAGESSTYNAQNQMSRTQELLLGLQPLS